MIPPADDTPRRILVIDDNTSIHNDFRKILAPQESGADGLADAAAGLLGGIAKSSPRSTFEMHSAFQGREGLAAVQESVRNGRPFAIAFVDVRMPPGWDGIETTTHLWEADPDLQVVICTAYSDYDLDEIVAQLGLSDRFVILKKPFDPIEVVQLANALAEKRRLLERVHRQVNDLEETVSRRTEELRKSEERFRLITECAEDLIGVTDPEGARLYGSPSYERFLGYTRAELSANGAFDQVHPEDRDRAMTAIRTTLEKGLPQVCEYRLRHKNGTWVTVESHAVPFRNAGGTAESVLTVARDITERKQAEQERQLMEAQLRQAQKLEAIGQLAAGIAHEINTPTQYIGDNTRFLQDGFKTFGLLLPGYRRLLQACEAGAPPPALVSALNAEVRDADLDYLLEQVPTAIQQTLEGIERVAKIVRAMKEFSHPGSKEKTAIDIHKNIENTITVARNEWKYVAEVQTDFDPLLPPVRCFAGEFNQVILNLLVNAAQAIGETQPAPPDAKGLITVSTRRDGEWAEIRLADTGPGVPPEARPHLFEPFFTTKEVGKGTGQGLATVYAIVVKKHGGTVTFETEVGRGTTFIVRLPLGSLKPGGSSR